MKEDLILVGGGGHCHAMIDVIEATNQFNIVGIIDKAELLNSDVLGYKVIGNDSDIPDLAKTNKKFLITIGQIKNSIARTHLYQLLIESGASLPTVISPRSYVAKNVSVGQGTVVMHHALINANVKLGVNNIINSKALVEHDCTIGDHNHVSTNVVINGGCTIQNRCFIGSSAVINQEKKVASDVVLASMSLVNRDIVFKGTYAGIPAKQIK